MPRDGTGNYALPEATFVAGTTISSTKVNSDLSDVASALTASLAKDGQTTPTANLPMGGYRHTNVAAAAARTDYARMAEVADSTPQWGGTSTGSADAQAIAPTPSIAAYAAGQTYRFVAGYTNATTTPTLAVSGLAAKTIRKDNGALAASDIVAGRTYEVVYDGTYFQISMLAGAGSYTVGGQSAGGALALTDKLGSNVGGAEKYSTVQQVIDKVLAGITTSGMLRQITTFTANGTYTKSSWVKFVIVEVIGGGGSGGGAVASGATVNAAGGGGGGGYAQEKIAAASLGATETVTVGAGGAAAPGGSGGNSGGTSSFGAHCSATGGSGGYGSNTSSTTANKAGGAGGVGAGGDINFNGYPGGSGHNGDVGASGFGGGTVLSGGPGGQGPTEGAGTAPTANSGAGSCGALSAISGSNSGSNAGAAGIVRVWEFE